MSQQYAFHVDISKCTGCKTCQVACKDKNNLPSGVRFRRVFQYEGGEWLEQNGQMVPSNVFAYFVSAACMHCEEPICVKVCPTKASYKREDGIVLIDQDKCIGCRYCSWACPYGAPQFNVEISAMTKCDFCYDLLEKGEKPACVDACPFQNIHFGPLEEMRKKYGTFSSPAPLPSPKTTRPSIVYTPSGVTKSTGDVSGMLKNIEEV